MIKNPWNFIFLNKVYKKLLEIRKSEKTDLKSTSQRVQIVLNS